MNPRPFVLLILPVAFWGCGGGSKTGNPAPAKVEAHPNEADIYRLTLTPKAVERLGIETVPVTKKSLPRHRTVGGELRLPDGASLLVTSPVSGTIRKNQSGDTPIPGTKLSVGETVLVLDPLLSPERYVPTPAERVQMANAQVGLVTAQVTADGDVKRAEAEMEAAQIALKRAEQLLKDRAGPARDVDDAKARFDIANESLKAARERLKALKDIRLDVAPSPETGARKNVEPLPITAPQSGVLQNVAVAEGQYVTAGANLFEVIKLETLWVRVPVYVGLLDELEAVPVVQVRSLDQPETESVPANAITAPPTADPVSATADLYFDVANPEGRFRPGERVYVTLPLTDQEERLVIPRDAVLWDIQGTSWVYVHSGPEEYRRARILIDFTTDTEAVLSYGPDPGTEVVTAGAAELFGTEFGAKK
jgi:RND family efflux transporter MFP subunit